jgi:hypothetical protein
VSSFTNFPQVAFAQPDGTTIQQNIVFIEQWYRSHLKQEQRKRAMESRQRGNAA